MRKLLFAAVFLLTAITIGFAGTADIPREKQLVIDQLLLVSGYDKNFDTTMKLLTEPILKIMIEQLKKANPNLPDYAMTIMREEILAVMGSEKAKKSLREKLYPIYDKIYTIDELRELVNFYSSPVGKKLVASMPQILKECTDSGRAWALELTPEMSQRVRKRLESEKLLPRA